MAFTSQSSHVYPTSTVPYPPGKKSHFCCSYIHWSLVTFLVAGSLKEDQSFSTCIQAWKHPLRRTLLGPLPTLQPPCHHLYLRAVGSQRAWPVLLHFVMPALLHPWHCWHLHALAGNGYGKLSSVSCKGEGRYPKMSSGLQHFWCGCHPGQGQLSSTLGY